VEKTVTTSVSDHPIGSNDLTRLRIGQRERKVRIPRRRWSATAREDFWTGLLCLTPTLAITLVFVVVPVVFSFYLSFHHWNILKPEKPFVGLTNYQRMFATGEFWVALKNTVLYTVGVVPIGATISLLLALLLDQKIRGLSIYRTAYFMPVVTSTIVVAVVWTWIYNPYYGLINALLKMLKLPQPGWLVDPNCALLSIIIMSIWKNMGYHMVIFLAGLQNIPHVYYEAAAIDGAGRLARFRHITWPMLRPTTALVLMTSIIFSFQVFGPVYVMTGGGPMRSTTVLLYYIYQRGFGFKEMGYASAVAWVLFFIIFGVSLVQFWYSRRSVEE
jgi:multiple sugar transport system permease protein